MGKIQKRRWGAVADIKKKEWIVTRKMSESVRWRVKGRKEKRATNKPRELTTAECNTAAGLLPKVIANVSNPADRIRQILYCEQSVSFARFEYFC